MVPPVEKHLDPDALVAELESLPPSSKKGHLCSTAALVSELPEHTRPLIQELLDRDDLSAPAVCKVLARHGLSLQSSALARHRKRGTPTGCRCPREAVS
jgi:hypothetical protein